MPNLHLATQNGFYSVEQNNNWQITKKKFEGRNLTCITKINNTLLLGTQDGVYHSKDEGEFWNKSDGVTIPHVRWLDSDGKLFYAGTEPAGLFISSDNGSTWSNRTEVETLRDNHQWMLPYSPEDGCVRGFAHHGSIIYGAVEVGGVLRSNDSGKSWNLAPGSDGKPKFGTPQKNHVHPDVHSIYVHPNNPDFVLAPTGGGLYQSQDGGVNWELIYDCYCRAAWWDSNDVDHIIFGPADWVGSQGRIEESFDGGKTWQYASGNLDIPWSRTIPERFYQIDNSLFCILDDGRLLCSSLDQLDWKFILSEISGINAISYGN